MKPAFYTGNQSYVEGLRGDPRRFQTLPALCRSKAFHGKYVDVLAQDLSPGAAVLDVGCGAGQVVAALLERGFASAGVDVSPGVDAPNCQPYAGGNLPFSTHSFSAVGAFNVLEHVEEPIAFLDEMVRVLKPGGRLVVSSPNFLRVLGWRDYHPHMRGWRQKGKNLGTLFDHARLYRRDAGAVRFETMAAIWREVLQPDDDATVVTSALDLHRYFQVRGFGGICVSCVDRPLPRVIEFLLDLTPLRYGMLNAFVTGRKQA